MKFLAIGDEIFELDYLEKVLHESAPDCKLMCFTKPSKALEYIACTPVDAVFLDIGQDNTDGFRLARQFKDIRPDVYIIFISNFEQGVLEFIRLFPVGYLQKPITTGDIQRELLFFEHRQPVITKKRYPSENVSTSENRKKFQIFCFGEFSIYYDELPVHLSGKKAYELIAYLIVHHGHPVSKWEIASRLWEDSEDFRARDSLYKVLRKIKQTEMEIGCSLVGSKRQKIFLEKDGIQCTLWEFEELYQNKSIPNYEKAVRLFKEMLFGGEAYSWILEEEGRYELMYLEIVEYLLAYYQTTKAYNKIVYYENLLRTKDL